MAFDAAAVLDLFDKVTSHAASLGLFDSQVGTHEPKNAPGNGLWCAIWVQGIGPIPSSGLASVSGRVELRARIGSAVLPGAQGPIKPALPNPPTIPLGGYPRDPPPGRAWRGLHADRLPRTPPIPPAA